MSTYKRYKKHLSSHSKPNFIQKPSPRTMPKNYAYQRKWNLITKSELKFFQLLLKVVDSYYYVIPQVHLSTLFQHKVWGQNWRAALSRIQRKSVDYVICCRQKLVPICAIELDDLSHQKEDRKKRDKVVEDIFHKAKLPLIRIPTSQQNDEVNLRKQLHCIEIPNKAQPTT